MILVFHILFNVGYIDVVLVEHVQYDHAWTAENPSELGDNIKVNAPFLQDIQVVRQQPVDNQGGGAG